MEANARPIAPSILLREDRGVSPPTIHSSGAAVLQQRILVEYSYSVRFTRDVLDADNRTLVDALASDLPSRPHRVFAVLEKQVASSHPALEDRLRAYIRAHSTQLALAADPVTVPGGEGVKNSPELIASLQRQFCRACIDRHSFVLCIGGGAVQDAVGYAAATTHRGVRMVRLPTTVLAQNDSGVGVKNAINAHGKKNFLGTFAPPFAVINDTAFLSTLPRRERVAGMSEAVKVALIRDAAFFDWLEHNSDSLAAGEEEPLEYLIRRCAELHLRHIGTSGDPFEFGSARPLDFGHWSAHKLESMTGYRLRHGEAVAIGVAIDVLYSEMAGYLAPAEAERVLRLLGRLGLPLWDAALDAVGEVGRLRVLDGLAEFREHLGGELTVTLLRALGDGFEVHQMDEALIQRAILRLRQLSRGQHEVGPMSRAEPDLLHPCPPGKRGAEMRDTPSPRHP